MSEKDYSHLSDEAVKEYLRQAEEEYRELKSEMYPPEAIAEAVNHLSNLWLEAQRRRIERDMKNG